MTSDTTSGGSLDAVRDRRIIVGVSGGIAVYKACIVVSRLAQAGAEVTVLMTDAATQFVTPLTFQALSGRPVHSDQWTHVDSSDPQHIALARRSDLVLVAPATMDLLARLASGFTDDVVSLVCSAVDRRTTPVIVAPSMNAVMWEQPANRRNVETLRGDGYEVIDPDSGWQACRTEGPGRLPEPEALLDLVATRLAEIASPPA